MFYKQKKKLTKAIKKINIELIMKKLFKIIVLISLLVYLASCKTDSDSNLFNGIIVGSRWHTYYNDYDKTFVFDSINTAYITDKHFNQPPIIYTHFTYNFDQNTWVGKLEAVDENMLGADFYITKNGGVLSVKNEAVEITFNFIAN